MSKSRQRAFVVISPKSHQAVTELTHDGNDLRLVVQNENYHLIHELGEPFYPSVSDTSTAGDRAMKFSTSWYKDLNGTDVTELENGFSLGALLSCGLSVEFAPLARESAALEHWLKKVDEVLFPSNYPLKRYIDLLDLKNVSYYDFESDDVPISSAYSFRKYEQKKHVHWLKRFVSLPFAFLNRILVPGKNLYINDWTYRHLLSEDSQGLMINGSSFKRNVFHSTWLPRKSVLPKDIKDRKNLWTKCIETNLEKSGFDLALAEPIWNILETSYLAHRALFESTYQFYYNILKLRPLSITLPTDLWDDYNIALQLAKMFKIKTNQLIDGFPITASYPYLTNRNGYFFSNVFVQSKDFMKQFILFRGYSSQQIELVTPYSISRLEKLQKQHPTIDALVYTLIPNTLNPDYRLFHLREFVKEVCTVLKQKGLNNIVIKCKSSVEEVYAKTIADEMGVSYSMLPSLEIMPKAAMIVGGISSAAMEAHLLGIPYYLYEPYENAYTDHQLAESAFKVKESTARSPKELKQNLDTLNYFGCNGFLDNQPDENVRNY